MSLESRGGLTINAYVPSTRKFCFGQLIPLKTHFWLLTQVIIWTKRITDGMISKVVYDTLQHNLRYKNMKDVSGNLNSLRIMPSSSPQYEQSRKVIRRRGGRWKQSKKNALVWLGNNILSSICVFFTSSHLSQGWHCQSMAASCHRSGQGQGGIGLSDFRKITLRAEMKVNMLLTIGIY